MEMASLVAIFFCYPKSNFQKHSEFDSIWNSNVWYFGLPVSVVANRSSFLLKHFLILYKTFTRTVFYCMLPTVLVTEHFFSNAFFLSTFNWQKSINCLNVNDRQNIKKLSRLKCIENKIISQASFVLKFNSS